MLHQQLKITLKIIVKYKYICRKQNIAVTYLKIPLEDEDLSEIDEYFEAAYNFITLNLEENNSNVIFVHCSAGMSRSATIVIMYLMKKYNLSYD